MTSASPPFHGSLTHRIQINLLLRALGIEAVESLFQVMASDVGVRRVPGRDGGEPRSFTLWDDLLDRPARRRVPTAERRSCESILGIGDIVTGSGSGYTAANTSSPEWLWWAVASGRDRGLVRLSGMFREEFRSRIRERHADVFLATGCDEYRRVLLGR